MPLKASKEMAELAKELEDLLHRMSNEQLQDVVDVLSGREPNEADEVAKRLAKTELARRQLH